MSNFKEVYNITLPVLPQAPSLGALARSLLPKFHVHSTTMAERSRV